MNETHLLVRSLVISYRYAIDSGIKMTSVVKYRGSSKNKANEIVYFVVFLICYTIKDNLS